MTHLFSRLRPRGWRTRAPRSGRSPWVAAVAVAAALSVPASASAASAAPAFGSMDVTVAAIANLAYGGVAPATITFDGTGSYCLESCSLTSYDWTFGDGGTASGPIVSHTFQTTGLWTVTLTVHSTNGLTGTASTTANVFSYTQAKVTITPTVGLLPLNATLDGRASVSNWDRPIVSYAWDFGDGTTGSGALVNHVYTTPGIRTVSLTVTDSKSGLQTSGGYIYVQDPLLAPNNLKATSPTKGTASLTWTNRMVMAQNLSVQRCTGSSCTSFATIMTLPATYTNFQDTGLRSGTSYRYRIAVLDYLGKTAYSSIVTVKAR